MTLEYAKKCREAYSLGKEKEYIKCILDSADEFAERNPRGTDKHTVIRGTKLRLWSSYNHGSLPVFPEKQSANGRDSPHTRGPVCGPG